MPDLTDTEQLALRRLRERGYLYEASTNRGDWVRRRTAKGLVAKGEARRFTREHGRPFIKPTEDVDA